MGRGRTVASAQKMFAQLQEKTNPHRMKSDAIGSKMMANLFDKAFIGRILPRSSCAEMTLAEMFHAKMVYRPFGYQVETLQPKLLLYIQHHQLRNDSRRRTTGLREIIK